MIVCKGLNFKLFKNNRRMRTLRYDHSARKFQTVGLSLAALETQRNGLSFPADGCGGHQRVSVVRQKEEHLIAVTQTPGPNESVVRQRGRVDCCPLVDLAWRVTR